MTQAISLLQLLNLVQESIDAQFYGQGYWVRCEVTDVKKYEAKNWCFCKLLEKRGPQIVAESPAVFWQHGYQHIRRFEQGTGQKFESGIAILCRVLVKFHPIYGLKLEVQEIDLSFTLGQMELARQATLARLLATYPQDIRQMDDAFLTTNNQRPLPRLIQRIALITAANSDGQRDFVQELTHNAYGYHFSITGFYTTIQGTQAAGNMVLQLRRIETIHDQFDAVVIVRGGGSQTDLKPFDDYDLAANIALFPIPVLTGIGHDRNTSIADLMARQYKVPTKVAAAIVEHNHATALALMHLQERMQAAVEAWVSEKKQGLLLQVQLLHQTVPTRIAHTRQALLTWKNGLHLLATQRTTIARKDLEHLTRRLQGSSQQLCLQQKAQLAAYKRLVAQLAPEATLRRGFALVWQQGKLVTAIHQAQPQVPLVAQLPDGSITAHIVQIEKSTPPSDETVP